MWLISFGVLPYFSFPSGSSYLLCWHSLALMFCPKTMLYLTVSPDLTQTVMISLCTALRLQILHLHRLCGLVLTDMPLLHSKITSVLCDCQIKWFCSEAPEVSILHLRTSSHTQMAQHLSLSSKISHERVLTPTSENKNTLATFEYFFIKW